MTREQQKARRRQAVALYVKDRLSMSEVSRQLGIEKSYVSRIIKDSGAEVRQIGSGLSWEERRQRKLQRRRDLHAMARGLPPVGMTPEAIEGLYHGRTYA